MSDFVGIDVDFVGFGGFRESLLCWKGVVINSISGRLSFQA